jgi:hypothetical protein
MMRFLNIHTSPNVKENEISGRYNTYGDRRSAYTRDMQHVWRQEECVQAGRAARMETGGVCTGGTCNTYGDRRSVYRRDVQHVLRQEECVQAGRATRMET